MIRRIVDLAISPFSLLKGSLTAALMLTMLTFGEGAYSSLIGRIAVFQSTAMVLGIIIRQGIDTDFARRIKNSSIETDRVYAGYIAHCVINFCFVSPLFIILSLVFHFLGLAITISSALFGLSLAIGNMIRIGKTPELQILYDITSVNLIVFYFCYFTNMSSDVSIFAFSSAHLLINLIYSAYSSWDFRRKRERAKRSFSYFLSEMSNYAFGAGTVVALSSVYSDSALGTFRAIERISYASTFILFVINNRAFFDFSKGLINPNDKKSYFLRYAFPSGIFSILFLTGAVLFSFTEYGTLISNNMTTFLVISFGYVVSSMSGPIATVVNLLGRETKVLRTNIMSALIYAAFLLISFSFKIPFLLIIGMSAAISINNVVLLQVYYRGIQSRECALAGSAV